MKPYTIVSRSADDTRRVGIRLATVLSPGSVLLLSGELGAGKTTFTQGVAAGLGIREAVTSPTFVLAHEFAGRIPLYHLDFYRLKDGRDLQELGFDDYLWGDGICVAEWPERVDSLPDDALAIHFEVVSDHERSITVGALGPRHEAMLASFAERNKEYDPTCGD
ncbi:MAG: tRNA (adenosine(37)-N6)-threonylcarbamoyltransferase complex ATPase subunit type 1 TsaE [Chloroflexi bacterium]|nr:tRNA (adenosine(37)-N6)-threonylcarbamoyltransferase complex ATPase subunit type 1 TsaE [Chloroflexota bacterium]